MTQDSGSGRGALGGRVGTTIVALTPIIAAIIFVVLGLTIGAWAWAWVFFLAIPIVALIVYGPGNRSS